MDNEISEAIDFYLEHGFVTECDFCSIGSTPFRKELKNKLEQYDVNFEGLAFEVKGQFIYFFYNVTEFPVYPEMEKFIRQYMEQRS